MKKHIPNFITLCNLMAGTVALLMVLSDKPGIAVILILSAAVFDFLDGTAARLLHVTSETGKQLDSLADIVSFGIVPAAFLYKIILFHMDALPSDAFWNIPIVSALVLISILVVPAFSAIRLARFNLQKGTGDFLGLPTPAHALFWTGIYYDIMINGSLYGKDVNVWFTWIIMLVLAGMMILPLPMLSFKFANLGLRNNIFRYLALVLACILIIILHIPGLAVLILVYILLSLVRIVLR